MTEVILLEDVEKLGKKGERVKVRGGFFRNFLYPRNKAVPANEANLKTYEALKQQGERRRKREKEKAVELSKKLERLTLRIPVAVGGEEKLFGSVTSQDIQKALEDQGIFIDRKHIELEENIRKTGSYSVKVRLDPEFVSSVKIQVVSERSHSRGEAQGV